MNPLLDAAKAMLKARTCPEGMDLRDWALRYQSAFNELQRQVAVAERQAHITKLDRQRRLFHPDNEAMVSS